MAIEHIKLPELPVVGRIELPLLPAIEREDRRAIVVAGVNFPRSPHYELPHAVKSQDRTYWRLANQYADWALTHGGITRVLIFDFLEGRLVERLKGSSTQKSGQRILPELNPLTDTNYRGWRKINGTWTLVQTPAKGEPMAYWTGLHKFAQANALGPRADIPFSAYWKGHTNSAKQENSMSIRDVYIEIVTSPAKSIHALHFFGNAVASGPVIVNTWSRHAELGYNEPSKRFDKDGRLTDFEGPIQQTASFKAAFANKASIGVWGSNINTRFQQDTLVPAMAEWKKTKKLDRDFERAIWKAKRETYAAALSTHLGQPVYSCLPGTFASHDGRSEEDADAKGVAFPAQLMHVNFAACVPILRFYAEAMRVKFPTTGLYQGHPNFGRGYAPPWE